MDKSQFLNMVKIFAGSFFSEAISQLERDGIELEKYDPTLAGIVKKHVTIARQQHEYCKSRLESK